MSGEDVFAEPMLEGREFLKDYANSVQKLLKEGVLPADLGEERNYKVYSLGGSGCGSHRSIVLSSDGQRFFSIELSFIVVNGTKRIYPYTEKIDPGLKGKFTYHGEVKLSTHTLLAKGVATMKKFGTYFKYCNNCQDFCNYYLEAIDLGDTKKLTDGDKIALAAIVSAVCVILLALIFKK